MRKVLLTIWGLACAVGLTAQWNSKENLRVTIDGIMDFEAQTNKDGITFVGFWDLVAEDPAKQGNRYSDDSDIAYYLQILDKGGNKLFPDNGRLVSHEPSRSFSMGDDKAIFTDSDGNALYIVKDERNWNNGNYPNQGYFVYKVSPSGQFLWDEPLDLDKGYAYYMVANIKVIELADGSYIFAHDIYLDGGYLSYITIDKVSKDGKFLWNEPLLLTNNLFSYSFPFLVDAGYGNFVIVYSKSPGYQMYAQKFDFDKGSVWSSPLPIYSGGFTGNASPFTAVEVISDQKGGCFVSWYDDRYNSKYEKAYVSHILPNGTQGFVTSNGEEGLRLSWNPYVRAFRPSLCYDPVGEILYAAWEEDDSDQIFRSIVLQKISKNGKLFWTNSLIKEDNTNGLVLDSRWLPESVGYYTIQLAGEGKIAVFHQHDYSSGNSAENIATLFDVSGEQPQQLNEKLIFAEKGKSKAGLLSLPLFDNNYFLTFWSDFRTSTLSNGAAVFAHKVLLDDFETTAIRFPETGSNSRFEIISDKANGTVDFVLDSSRQGNATLEIYSVTGQKATRIQSKVQAGENVISWNVQHLPASVYVAKLTTLNGVQVKQFIVK
ncbi:MAG: T9SS type A sorting domain-containing protein [Dysgonamonadaceae bacterium]|jgi:hypothetical protein|nr:T9SS type A sorting domain-containing protein [Dysgonamonadaceae bacterium]